jgi:thiamine biosynthesis lipoprotein ApbE
MDNNEKRELLNHIHDEINKIQQVDEKSSELLKDIDSDIRDLLENSGESPLDVNPSVVDRLETGIRHFEVTHPELTAAITKLIDSLSAAGV